MVVGIKNGSLYDYYLGFKSKFLTDKTICVENQKLFSNFFKEQEYKLKRINQLSQLDEACCKTLISYIQRLRNSNRWFNNKPWELVTKDDIRRVYDGLEDGVIVTQKGTPFKCRSDYYNKIFKGKPFRMVGKDLIAKSVIEFCKPNESEVRYVLEADFRKFRPQ